MHDNFSGSSQPILGVHPPQGPNTGRQSVLWQFPRGLHFWTDPFSCESGHASFRASLGCAVGPRQVAVLELSGMHTGAAQKTTTTKRTNSNTMPLPHPTATNIHHSTGGGVAKAVNVRLQLGVRQGGGADISERELKQMPNSNLQKIFGKNVLPQNWCQ